MSAIEERRWLGEVLERLPTGDCAGCHLCASRCAGQLGMTRTEYEAIREFLGGCEPFPAVRGNGQMAEPCGFRQPSGTGCIIYPVRPLICRLFGLVAWLPCPIGRAPLLIDDGPHIMRQYSEFERRTYRDWLRELQAGRTRPPIVGQVPSPVAGSPLPSLRTDEGVCPTIGPKARCPHHPRAREGGRRGGPAV